MSTSEALRHSRPSTHRSARASCYKCRVSGPSASTLPLIAFLAISLFSSLGCGGARNSGAGPTPETSALAPIAPAPPSEIEIPSEFRGQIPAIQNAAILDILPSDTVALYVARSPLQLSKTLEIETILREYPAFYSEADIPLTHAGTAHLLQPSTWSYLGVNADAPVGIAVLSTDGVSVGFLVALTLSNSELFRRSLNDLAAQFHVPDPAWSHRGTLDILSTSYLAGVAVVLRDASALLVIAHSKDELNSILTTIETGSTARARVDQIFSEFDYGKDFAGFISFGKLSSLLLDELERSPMLPYYANEVDATYRKMEELMSSGAPLEEIEAQRQARTEAANVYNKHLLERSAERDLTRKLLAPLGDVAFGIDFSKPSAGIRVRLHLPAHSLPGRLFASTPGKLQLPLRLNATPTTLVATKMNPKAAKELLVLAARSVGKSQHDLGLRAKQIFGIDLNQLLTNLGGEISAALTLNLSQVQAAPRSGDLFRATGLHFLLQVQDESTAQSMLALAAHSPGLREHRAEEGEGMALDIPSFNANPIRLRLDKGFFDARTVRSSPQEAPSSLSTELKTLGSGNNAAVALLDPVPLILMAALQDVSGEDISLEVLGLDNTLTKAELERLRIVEEKTQRLRRLREQLRMDLLFQARAQLGHLTLALKQGGRENAVLLGRIGGNRASISRGLQAIAEAVVPRLESMRTGKPTQIEEIEAKLERLYDER